MTVDEREVVIVTGPRPRSNTVPRLPDLEYILMHSCFTILAPCLPRVRNSLVLLQEVFVHFPPLLTVPPHNFRLRRFIRVGS